MRGLRCPAVIMHQRWSGQSKAVGGASRWTAVEPDGQMTISSAHVPHKGKILGDFEAVLTEIQFFMSGRPETAPDPGRTLQCELVRIDRPTSCGRVDPKTARTLMDTNDSQRARALHTVLAELDLTVTNTWMDADSERELYTRCSWTDPGESLTQMDFIMTSRKTRSKTCASAGLRQVQDRPQGGACCSFTVSRK